MIKGKDIEMLRTKLKRPKRQVAKEMGISTTWLRELEYTRADKEAPIYAQNWYAQALKDFEYAQRG